MIAVNSTKNSVVVKKFVLVVPEDCVMRTVRDGSLALVGTSVLKLDSSYSTMNAIRIKALEALIAEDSDGTEPNFLYIECTLPEPFAFDLPEEYSTESVETILSYTSNFKDLFQHLGLTPFMEYFDSSAELVWQFVVTDISYTANLMLDENITESSTVFNEDDEEDMEDAEEEMEDTSDEPEDLDELDASEPVEVETKPASTGRVSLEDMLPVNFNKPTSETVDLSVEKIEEKHVYPIEWFNSTDHLSGIRAYIKTFDADLDFDTFISEQQQVFISLIPDYLEYLKLKEQNIEAETVPDVKGRIESEELDLNLVDTSAEDCAKVYLNCLFHKFAKNLKPLRSFSENWNQLLDTTLTSLLAQCTAMFNAPNSNVRVSRTGSTTNIKQLCDMLALVSSLSIKTKHIDYQVIEEFMTLTYNMSNTLIDPVCNILALLHNTELKAVRNWTKRSKAASTLFLMNFFKGFLTYETEFDTNSAYTVLATLKALYGRDGRFDENTANELLVYSGNVLPSLFIQLGLNEIYEQTVGAKVCNDLSSVYTDTIESLNRLPNSWTITVRSRNLSSLIEMLDEFCSVVDNDAISFSVASLVSEILYLQTKVQDSEYPRTQKSVIAAMKQLLVALNASGDTEQEVGDTRTTVFDAVFDILFAYSNAISKQRVTQAPNKNVSLLNQLGDFLGVKLN